MHTTSVNFEGDLCSLCMGSTFAIISHAPTLPRDTVARYYTV